jgi:hypothetical protein
MARARMRPPINIMLVSFFDTIGGNLVFGVEHEKK